MKKVLKKIITTCVPLGLRKRMAVRINRLGSLNPITRAYWATELLVDFAVADPNSYHKFLWANHLGYARTYEVDERFGYEKFNESRKILFKEMPLQLAKCGIDDSSGVNSVLDVGCSLGYLLRYMETDVFEGAADLVGVDVDEQAIENGKKALANMGSEVSLYACDLETMSRSIGDKKFDIVFASGVLLYFDEDTATSVIEKLVARTNKVLIITGLAHPDSDNNLLQDSIVRRSDGTWIHNIDRMLRSAGAEVLARRWEGERIVDGNTIYFLYAVPGG